jgi:hypothetical protein
MGKTKICSTCKVKKDVSLFYRDKGKPDGRKYQCKACREKTSTIYRLKNLERIRENQRRFHEKNPEKARQYEARYIKKNPDKMIAKGKKCRDDLSGRYIKGLLNKSLGIKSEQVTEWLIEAKRSHLNILREIREGKRNE